MDEIPPSPVRLRGMANLPPSVATAWLPGGLAFEDRRVCPGGDAASAGMTFTSQEPKPGARRCGRHERGWRAVLLEFTPRRRSAASPTLRPRQRVRPAPGPALGTAARVASVRRQRYSGFGLRRVRAWCGSRHRGARYRPPNDGMFRGESPSRPSVSDRSPRPAEAVASGPECRRYTPPAVRSKASQRRLGPGVVIRERVRGRNAIVAVDRPVRRGAPARRNGRGAASARSLVAFGNGSGRRARLDEQGVVGGLRSGGLHPPSNGRLHERFPGRSASARVSRKSRGRSGSARSRLRGQTSAAPK